MAATKTLPRLAYSPQEIAQMLGISDGKVTRDIRSKVLPAKRIGRQWRVLVEDVDAYIGRGTSADDAVTQAS